jgi:hypothetical protein
MKPSIVHGSRNTPNPVFAYFTAALRQPPLAAMLARLPPRFPATEPRKAGFHGIFVRSRRFVTHSFQKK